MICEKAFYPTGTGENRERLYCKDERSKDFFNGKCPLIYWCAVSGKFENTSDMFGCPYREKEGVNDG